MKNINHVSFELIEPCSRHDQSLSIGQSPWNEKPKTRSFENIVLPKGSYVWHSHFPSLNLKRWPPDIPRSSPGFQPVLLKSQQSGFVFSPWINHQKQAFIESYKQLISNVTKSALANIFFIITSGTGNSPSYNQVFRGATRYLRFQDLRGQAQKNQTS